LIGRGTLGSWPFGLLGGRVQKGSIADEAQRRAVVCKPVHQQWGYATIWLYALSWIAPDFLLQFLRTSYLVSSALWCLIIYLRLQLRPKMCFPVACALILQLWSIGVAVWVSFHLGRQIGIGRADFYLMEHLVPFFVASGLLQIDPKARQKLMKIMLIVLGISCAVAWAQFFKVPYASKLANYYTYKDIDFWDGTVGLRAVGLTFHPGVLAAEGLMALAIVGSRVIVAMPRRNDFLLMLFFSGAVVFSQARAMYAVLFAIWIFFCFGIIRRDQKWGLMVIATGIVLVGLGMFFGQNRLGYALQSSNLDEDPSYQFRAQNVWIQLDPIYDRFPVTGIGPSPGLLLGTGKEDKWVVVGRVMESGYRLMLAMYGIPGLMLFLFALVGSAAICLRQSFNTKISADRRRWMVSGFAMSASILIAAYTGNTVDGYTVLPYAFLVAGMCVFEGRGKEHRTTEEVEPVPEPHQLPSRFRRALTGR
jgi:hypothetical protein